jgi:hypothetical protein
MVAKGRTSKDTTCAARSPPSPWPRWPLLAPVALAGSALAQMPSPEKIHKAWDTNADGGIDKAEWVAAGRKEDASPRPTPTATARSPLGRSWP